MQRTLLSYVQSYLTRTDGFYVDSIFDTDESQQVAEIASEVYYDLVEEFPMLFTVQKDMNLDAYGDPSKPVYLNVPKNLLRIQESKLWYNVAQDDQGVKLQYQELKYLTPIEFNRLTSLRSDKADNTEIMDTINGTQLVIFNDKFPTYFTSYDDLTVIFDSYNNEYDTTLQASKVKVVATEEPVFLIEDDFIVPISSTLSSTYLYNVLAECYNALRQETNTKLETKARRGRIKMQQLNGKVGSTGKPPINYGRHEPSSYNRNRRTTQN